jgi:hypothetical protein
VRGKGTKLGEGCPKVRLSQDRRPILGEGERDFRDYYADLWFDSGFFYVRDCFIREKFVQPAPWCVYTGAILH